MPINEYVTAKSARRGKIVFTDINSQKKIAVHYEYPPTELHEFKQRVFELSSSAIEELDSPIEGDRLPPK